jgi:hypothetical protein
MHKHTNFYKRDARARGARTQTHTHSLTHPHAHMRQVGVSNTVLLQCAVVNRWLGLMMGFAWYYVGRHIGARKAFLVAMGMTLISAVMCAMIRRSCSFLKK